MDTTTNHSLIQGSPEWFKIRLGKFTSSEIHRLLTEPKSKKEIEGTFGLSKGAVTYVLEKVYETMTGEPAGGFDNEATVWGVQNEPLAREWYSKKTGLSVTEIGFYPGF